MIKFNSILQMNSDFLDDRSKLKAVLLDLYPTEKRMINLLLILYDYGVPEELKQAPNSRLAVFREIYHAG